MTELFNDLQLTTLRATLDRLIPADDFPGAWEVGCGEYVSRQLSGQLAHLLPDYRVGLDGLNAEAIAEFGGKFSELNTDQQDALLQRVESGQVRSEWLTPPAAFFSMLVNHAAEGYYADPGQGGNRDRISWKMMGFNGR